MNSSEQKKRGYHYKKEDLYTCVVFLVDDVPPGKELDRPRPVCLKYRNIPVDKPAPFERFTKFLLKEFPTAKYMNVYGGQSRDFYKQIKL